MIGRVRLGDIADVFNGKTPSKAEQRDHGHPVLKVRDVDEHGKHRGNTLSFVDPELAAKYPSKWVKAGDTLILNAAHNADYVASKTYFAGDEAVGSLATGEWLVVRAHTDAVHPAFVNYWFRYSRTRDSVRFLVKGIHLYPKDVADLEVALPALAEQRRIVDLLARAEGIARLRREAQQKAAELIPAIFIDMFGDPATNPKDWPLHQFGDVGRLDRGRSRHRPRNASMLYEGPYPFIQTGDVSNSGGRIRRCTSTYSEAGLAQSKLWNAGTLCITIAANIANTGVLEFDACFPDSVVGFIPGDLVRVGFVQAWLGFLQPTLEASAPQAAQKNINLEILRALPIPVPPIELQDAFVDRCEWLVGLGRQQAAALTSARAIFDSLLASAFLEA